MFALSFIYVTFLSHLTYILLERKYAFYKSRVFWLLLIGFASSIFLTVMMFKNM